MGEKIIIFPEEYIIHPHAIDPFSKYISLEQRLSQYTLNLLKRWYINLNEYEKNVLKNCLCLTEAEIDTIKCMLQRLESDVLQSTLHRFFDTPSLARLYFLYECICLKHETKQKIITVIEVLI